MGAPIGLKTAQLRVVTDGFRFAFVCAPCDFVLKFCNFRFDVNTLNGVKKLKNTCTKEINFTILHVHWFIVFDGKP